MKPYRYAAGTLLQCGFAAEQEHLSGTYVLNVSSDNFVLRAGPGLDLQFGSYPASAFLEIFSINCVMFGILDLRLEGPQKNIRIKHYWYAQ